MDSTSSVTQADPILADAEVTLHFAKGFCLAERYILEKPLGRGSSGAVYKARDLHLQIFVAIKILNPELSRSKKALERLQQEIVLGRRITHPNVCRLYDLGQSGEHWFVTMELIEGVDLKTALEQNAVEPQRVLLDICAALSAAHKSAVVHRDLKPKNVMVEPNTSKATVLDFGLAIELECDGERSPEAARVGTPAYWSPEQARGEVATAQSDIWAIGMIAKELYGDPLPKHMESIVQTCLRAEPAARFSSVDSLGEAVRAAPHFKEWRSRAAAGLLLAVLGFVLALLLLVLAPPRGGDLEGGVLHEVWVLEFMR